LHGLLLLVMHLVTETAFQCQEQFWFIRQTRHPGMLPADYPSFVGISNTPHGTVIGGTLTLPNISGLGRNSHLLSRPIACRRMKLFASVHIPEIGLPRSRKITSSSCTRLLTTFDIQASPNKLFARINGVSLAWMNPCAAVSVEPSDEGGHTGGNSIL